MESKIQKSIIKYLESIGAYVIKLKLTNASGNPDIICCYQGRFIAIEVKNKGNEATKLQQHKLEQIMLAGGIAMVAYSVADVKLIFEI